MLVFAYNYGTININTVNPQDCVPHKTTINN